MPVAVGVVILAAGGATRFGAPKQLLRYHGESLVRHAARVAVATTCRPVVVVTGAAADAVERELVDLDLSIVLNVDWPTGIATSFRTGIVAIAAHAVDAAVIILADQPEITAETIARVVTQQRATGKPIVACDYGGTLGPPTLFTRRFFAELCALRGDEGARRLFHRYPDELATVAAPEAALDVDTPADAARLGIESPKPA